MNRHPLYTSFFDSLRSFRLWALVAVLLSIDQLTDGSAGIGLATTVMYTVSRLSLLALLLFASNSFVVHKLAGRWDHPPWLKPVVCVSALALVPYAAFELFMESLIPVPAEQDDSELFAVSPLLAYLSEYVTLATVILPVHLLLWLILEPRDQLPNHDARIADSGAEQVAPAATEFATPKFLEKTPEIHANEIIAMEAQEHYIRVYSATQKAMVLYRFNDAVVEMPDAIGMRVHRSWWVANGAVTSATRGVRRWQLLLGDELKVPVSDSYVAAARERGLLRKKH